MTVGLYSLSNLLPVKGVRFAAGSAGIYSNKDRDDLVLIEIAKGSMVSGVFTKNAFCAAPVRLAKSHLSISESRMFIINAGNANAGTGSQGLTNSLSCCESLAQIANCQTDEVLPFSTGVIGEQLPVESIIRILPDLYKELDESSCLKSAEAIMTTDTVPKAISKQLVVNGETITITGIAKGSGMIRPDMATMLAYIATDAKIEKELLKSLLTELVELSFNRITVDGDTSTNDACMLLATGQSDAPEIEKNNSLYIEFKQNLTEVFCFLAQAIIRDGEGATKFITINIDKGVTQSECLIVAYTIAHSPLVKTALFASDPNWGRILAAVGRSGIEDLDVNRVDIYLDEVCIIKQGELSTKYTEDKGQQVMNKDEITIKVVLHRGIKKVDIWTTDLSYDYVKINAEYRT